jgi:hypothetical protein
MRRNTLLFFNILLIYLFISSTPIFAKPSESRAKVSVSASIPEKTHMRIFGYTAPSSIVQAQSIRVFGQTNSDPKGYFLFEDLSISKEAKEICLSTIDTQKRVGFPLCVALPDTDKPTEIGPLLLSPTLSLSTASLIQNDSAHGTGKTVPNEEVFISFFENSNSKSKAVKVAEFIEHFFFPQTYANTRPILQTKSDNSGTFSFNLPTARASTYRLFARSFYEGAPTPKSQTLTFYIAAFIVGIFIFLLRLLLYLLIFLILAGPLIYFEVKTKKGRFYFALFIEKQWKPFEVRSRLALRRLWYGLRESWHSHQK